MASFISGFYIILLVPLVIASSLIFKTFSKKTKKLPPSPRAVPILGHLHLLGKIPHRDLHELAKKHGPIMYLKLGLVPHIIVSSPQAAELFLKTYDLNFASRPPHEAAKHMGYDQSNMTFGKYGSYWRNMRKLVVLELLSSDKLSSFQPMRREEIGLLIESAKRAAEERVPFKLSTKISSMTGDLTCRMVFGKKYDERDVDEKGFKALLQEVMELGIATNLRDYFPFMRRFDVQGLTKRLKNVSRVLDRFFEKIIDDHVRDKDSNEAGRTKDFIDTLMAFMNSQEGDFQFDRRHLKALMLDMFVTASDTSSATAEWALTELIRHPQTLQKVQKELEQVVGLNRMVEESDLGRLEYLNMVVKETLRLHPIAPLMLPHYSIEDCTVQGYHIPKESRVIINVHSLGRDPHSWDDPDKFEPERFVRSDVDLRGKHFQLIPFGSGRRACPGIQLGLILTTLILAQLLHCFDWKLPDRVTPQDLDMDEKFGIVVTRANNLKVIPTYRLCV